MPVVINLPQSLKDFLLEEQTEKPTGQDRPRAKNRQRRKAAGQDAAQSAEKTAAAQPVVQQVAENTAPTPPAAQSPVRPVAPAARMKPRHYGVLLSFLLMVIAPSAVTYWYLYSRAADQYASNVGFTVRKENTSAGVEILGGLTQLGGTETSDTDILYQFIQSQNLVELVDARLDLRAIYSKPKNDPIFTVAPDSSIEVLHKYWGRMVKISYGGSGLLQLEIRAFDPNDAQNVAQAIFEESSVVVNRLSAIAQNDATRYAESDLKRAKDELLIARQAITKFRNETQIVDPNADIQGQMGLLNNLNQQLATALIESDLLRDSTREGDPRLEQINRKIVVIEIRITEERKKLGVTSEGSGTAFADVVSIYEALVVEREFAEKSYLDALTSFNSARADAQRQNRYLAPFVEPTLAQTPQYPQRLILLGLVSVFIMVIWSILVLVAYSIKDRR